jgi:hypothetical protein
MENKNERENPNCVYTVDKVKKLLQWQKHRILLEISN